MCWLIVFVLTGKVEDEIGDCFCLVLNVLLRSFGLVFFKQQKITFV